MAFPEDPLGLRVEIKAGTWTDITGSVYTRNAIRHTRGIRSSGTTADPATVPITINNKGGRFSPRNPMSPYYGLIGRNTPVRLWIPGGTRYLDLDGSPQAYASTPDTAALDITGDLDLRIEAETSWYTWHTRMLIGKWGVGQKSYGLRLTGGVLQFVYSFDGVNAFFVGRTLPALPRRAALRVTLDADNGAGGFAVSHYWAPSLAGPWTQIDATYVGAGTLTLFSGTAPLALGPPDVVGTSVLPPLDGRVYAAEVRSVIDGPTVASPDLTAQPVGAAPFTDSSGRTWSLSGAAAVADRRELFVGEIASWPQKWVASGADVWTPVEAAGILRRYGQGIKALDSPLRRRIPSGNPVAYWPMEEERFATRAYSPIPGVNPASVTGLDFGTVDTLPASNALPRLSAAATLSAIVPTYTASGQWQVEMVYNADDKAPPTSGEYAEVMSVSATGTVRRLVVSMRADSGRIQGFDASGSVVFTLTSTFEYVAPFHDWHRLRAWAREEGDGTCTWQVSWENVTGRVQYRFFTMAGTAGRVTAVTATWGKLTEGWSVGHVSVLRTANNALYDGSDTGYAGETAWTRMQRLASEENLTLARIAGDLTTEQVGPQRPATLLALLQEAADADGGMLVEDRTRLGLLYRDRSSLYTQEPALVLDYAAGQIAAGSLEPTDDDSATRNDITITREGGSSARAVLEEGPLSVQDPPDGIGVYDEAISLNVYDDMQPEYIAPWRLHLRTYDGARYPSLTVRLHKHPELIDDVPRLREGDIIRLLNLPPWVAYGPVDLLVTGLTEQLLPRTWEVTLTCDPGGPWMTAKADHLTYGKANTSGSELAAPITATDTDITVRTTAGATWTDDPAETPFDIQVGGEVATVTTVGQLTTPNPHFVADTAGWAGQNAAIARDTTVRHWRPRAVASLKITPAGGTATAEARSGPGAAGSVSPGVTYRASMWVFSPTGWAQFQPVVNWHNASGFLSTSAAGAVPVPAGVWTFLSSTFTAPAGADRCVFVGQQGGAPAPADRWYLWGGRVTGPDAAFADSFTRTVSGGWGRADSGQTWVLTGAASSDRTVDGARGVVTLATTPSTVRAQTLPGTLRDCEVRARIQTAQVAAGNSLVPGVLLRFVDGVNYYRARLHFSTSGGVFVSVTRDVTQLGTSPQVGTYVAGDEWEVRARVDGHRVRIRAWKTGSPEPTVWHQDIVVTAGLIEEGAVGFTASAFSGNTNTAPVMRFDNFEVVATQRFTVTRSRNGVVKAHADKAPFALAYPAITSL